ncbi:MAG: sigma-54-dependent Fis family transcriptional regulator [Proteobacteria bacterium]|nr:sigma-54-dependent Fis family transcriptional regulator [Pseudomonadota bacterium]
MPQLRGISVVVDDAGAVPDGGANLSAFDLIGESPAFLTATRLLQRLSGCNVAVLLRGETGTGKELAARAIHYLGARRDQPFIPVNCGAIPDMLVESELFGHMRGAFTDAREAQVGLVAQADGGTLFLDEVDSLTHKAQIALLRFLQDGTFRPLGAKGHAHSTARVIAATNADLEQLVQQGAFRSDLFFRLAIVPVHLPPLRERAGDVALLATSFLRGLAEQQGGGPARIDPETLWRMERYPWPGNVRELANVMQRAFLLADGDCIRLAPDALGDDDHASGGGAGRDPMAASFHAARAQALADFERRFVCRALAESAGNVSLAARRSGKERRSFGRLIKKHGIDRAEYGTAG